MALQHDAKARILQTCMEKARSAQDIMAREGIPSVSCYRHIHELVAAGLLFVERSAVSHQGRPYDLYRTTVEWARLEVSPAGVVPTWRTRAEMRDRLQRLWGQLEDR